MCTSCAPKLADPLNPDAAADRLVDMLNQGALSLMVSIGHRTGLFDALSELPPAPVESIAHQAGLNARYVREWLAAMVSGGLIDYDADKRHYHLPEAYTALLTRAATPDNIAVFAQYIGLMGQVEDRIVDCFRHGGGVAYEYFPRFHAVMAEDSGQTVLPALEEHILPLAKGLAQRLEDGIEVLDVGCGRGLALQQLARRFPRSRFTGIDLNAEAINSACQATRDAGLNNLRFEIRDLSDFNQHAEPQRYDLVTSFDAIHDQAQPQNVLDGIHRTLKTGGTYLMQDIHASSELQNNLDHPIGTLLYTLSCMHCMTVSLAQGGAGLGTMWGEELAVSMLRQAGFGEVKVHQLAHDFQNSFYVMEKAA